MSRTVHFVGKDARTKGFTYQDLIDRTHPTEDTLATAVEQDRFAADDLAMLLVGERHEKRDLVDLVRWLILRKPEGLI